MSRPIIPILINRLSRPKPGETPEQILTTGRVILLEQMLPKIVRKKDAKEGADYFYLEDIHSRLLVHEEGELLDTAFNLLRQGRFNDIVATEIPRLTGN